MISIVSAMEASKGLTHFEEVLAVESLLFVASAFLSYLSTRNPQGAIGLERTADIFFAAGLIAMGVSTILEFL